MFDFVTSGGSRDIYFIISQGCLWRSGSDFRVIRYWFGWNKRELDISH